MTWCALLFGISVTSASKSRSDFFFSPLAFDYWNKLRDFRCAQMDPLPGVDAIELGGHRFYPWEYEVQYHLNMFPWAPRDVDDTERATLCLRRTRNGGEDDDELLGAYTLRVTDGRWDDGEGSYLIASLARSLNMSGCRLGPYLVRHALGEIRENADATGRMRQVSAIVDVRNSPSYSMFTACGFMPSYDTESLDGYRIYTLSF
jgi:hypothetical protein